MRTRLLAIALAMMVAGACNLFAQDNQQNTNPPPAPQSDDQVGQLEQGQQDLKAQVDQMRNDIADLQERVKRLEGGQQSQPSGQSPPAAAAPRSGGRASSSTSTTQTSSGQPQSYDVFYQKLQTGGHWFSDPTYGYVWQPDVASSREWRPYSDGRWAYTDRGWTWVSNEDFGWATYHYGRWVHRSDSGWIWIPGDEWAPAWVSWRESDEYSGWAPLPPEVADDSDVPIGGWVDSYYDIGPEAYVFVRTTDLGRETYRDVAIQPAQNVQFFTQTRNVTNVAFGGNGVVVNGPDYNRIASRAKIPQYKLNYVTENQGRFGTQVSGNQLQVMAPAMKLQRNASAQPKVERQLAQAAVDHGWTGIDQSKAAQLKQAIKQQAPPPASLPPKAAPKPVTAGGQNQPARGPQQPGPGSQQPAQGAQPTARGQQPATASPAPATPPATQQHPAQQQQPPQGGTTPPRPEASQAQPNMQQHPPSPTPGQQNQPAASPAGGGTSRETTRPAATPSPSAARPVERQEQHPAATPSRSAEPRNQPSGNDEQGIGRPSQREQQQQPATEHRTPAERPREQMNEAPNKAEPSSKGAETREVKPPQENRQEQPANRPESPTGARQELQREKPATKSEAPNGAGSEQRREQPTNRSEAPGGAMKEGGREQSREHARPTERGERSNPESNKPERREGQ
jgi:hypothetical protein